METTATDNWLTAEAAAQLIGCHRSTFDRVHDEYRVERRKVGGQYRYNPDDVQRMVQIYTPARSNIQLGGHRETTGRITPETLAAAEQAMMRRRALVLATCKRQPERRPFDVATELMRFGHV